jgi:arylsulfatase A-like enzyme
VGSHGSLHALHMLVPLLVSRPAGPGPWRTVDLFPTLLRALGEPLPAGLDGVPMVSGVV